MIYKEIELRQLGLDSAARLVLYIQNYEKDMLVQERPMVVLCPGGGYNHVSVREGESEALQFLAMGCHAAVLCYSVAPIEYPAQLVELATAIRYIREHGAEWHIKEDKVIVQGSSAGGHLAASLGVFWKEDWLQSLLPTDTSAKRTAKEAIRPDGMVLCYPVITSGEYAHRGSFENLLGEKKSGELMELLSLEKQVNRDTPKTFLWHTFTDGTVPVENSLLFVQALRKHQIPTEFHLYPAGQHGLALASVQTASAGGAHMQKECESWVELAQTWIENL